MKKPISIIFSIPYIVFMASTIYLICTFKRKKYGKYIDGRHPLELLRENNRWLFDYSEQINVTFWFILFLTIILW